MRRTAIVAFGIVTLTALTATAAQAYAHRRVQDVATANAPVASGPAQGGNTSFVAWTGLEAPAYAYGYALGLPADSNWRWIEERCYPSRAGKICVDGHWVRKQAGRCEEVSGHVIRRGNYIRTVPAGQVTACRP